MLRAENHAYLMGKCDVFVYIRYDTKCVNITRFVVLEAEMALVHPC